MGRTYTVTGVLMTEAGGGTIIDGLGLKSTEQFSTLGSVVSGINQSITGTTNVGITNGTLILGTYSRPRESLVFLDARVYLVESAGNTCDGVVDILHNGTTLTSLNLNSGNTSLLTLSVHVPRQIGAEAGSLTLGGRIVGVTGTPSMTVNSYRMTHLILGR